MKKSLYQFYNIDKRSHGSIWAEHEKCGKEEGVTPQNCIKQKIGETKEILCIFCGK